MTQADEKAAIAKAFDDAVSKLFWTLVVNLETQAESTATSEYALGRKSARRAFEIANEIADKP